MNDSEVEDVILSEYEEIGYSVFVNLSMSDYNKKVIIAYINRIIGHCILYWDNERFFIGSLIVKKEWRNKGIGKLLIERAIKEAIKLGFKKLYADVPIKSDNFLFYFLIGFEVEEVLRHYYGIGKHAFRLALSF